MCMKMMHHLLSTDHSLPLVVTVESLKNSFKDVTIARTGCGGDTPSTISVDFLNDHECKRCVGGYSARLNDTQTVAIKGPGTYRIVSMGGITGAPWRPV